MTKNGNQKIGSKNVKATGMRLNTLMVHTQERIIEEQLFKISITLN